MIEVYRAPQCSFSDDIVERLQEMVLAHRVHIVNDEQPAHLPVLKEGRRSYTSKAEIQTLLKQITQEMIVQREMQSDSCKIDPDTGDTCL